MVIKIQIMKVNRDTRTGGIKRIKSRREEEQTQTFVIKSINRANLYT